MGVVVCELAGGLSANAVAHDNMNRVRFRTARCAANPNARFPGCLYDFTDPHPLLLLRAIETSDVSADATTRFYARIPTVFASCCSFIWMCAVKERLIFRGVS